MTIGVIWDEEQSSNGLGPVWDCFASQNSAQLQKLSAKHFQLQQLNIKKR
jgi:hypothetical protein